MRWVFSLLLLYVGQLSAQSLPPLRIAITDSWTMPLVRFEHDQPVEGIVFELMNRLASHLKHRPEYYVLPRLRLQAAMQRGTIDVRCFVMPSWAAEPSDMYRWSPPLFEQRDWLVAGNRQSLPTGLASLPSQAIGTVLGFEYPALRAQFDSGYFKRDDARTQLQVLQMLQAGRYRYAISNQASLDWFNSQLPPDERLQPLVMLEEQHLSCMVRNAPSIPTQGILQALQRMKQSGEIEQVFERYSHLNSSSAALAGNQ